MARSSLKFLANQSLPVEVGTITVLPDGTAERRERTALNFTFDYTGTQFAAVIEPTADGATLRLDAKLAPMPYSAEGRDKRRDIHAIVAASRTGLTHGRFALDDQHHIHLKSELDIGSPVTPAALVTAATRMLIAATPWVALLRRHLGPTPPANTPHPAAAKAAGTSGAPRPGVTGSEA